MADQSNIHVDVKDANYAATAGTGSAVIYVYNYYGYSEEIRDVPVKSTEASPEDNLQCPYRGLFHFGPNDAEFFFGREAFVEDLVKATNTRHFIPVLGASGSGKSSVVFAGLVPQLQQKGHWKFTHFRPGVVRKKELRSIVDPFYALATALVPLYTPQLNETEQLAQANDLADFLRSSKILLSDVISNIQKNYPHHRVLLIADQFEEIYTVCREENVRRHFLDLLIDNIHPISQSQSPLVLVLTMRADFLGNALSYRPFADMLQNTDIKLGVMNRSELSQVIEKPAEKLGVVFEEGLVERILDDVENSPGNLPLLEFALTLLWQRRTGKQLTHAAYDAIGRVEGALAKYANDKYIENFTEDQRTQIQRIFIQLFRPAEGAEYTRRLATRTELGEENWDLVTRKDGLADNRLVVTSQNAAGEQIVEVVHEALIQNWDKPQQWMQQNQDFRAWQERLRVEMRQWEETKRDEGALLRGLPLAVAEEWLGKRPVDLSLTEQEYIRQSVKLRDRQRRKTIVILTGFSVVACVLALVAGTGWWRAFTGEKSYRIVARNSYSQTLFAANKQFDVILESIRNLKKAKHELGGMNSNTELQVATTLMQSVYSNQEQNRFSGYNQPFIRASFSLDGKKIAATNMEDTIKIWKLNGEEITTLNKKKSQQFSSISARTGDCPVNSVSFSPSSNTIAASDGDNIKIWDFNGTAIKAFPGKGKDVTVTSISNDGQLIAAVTRDGKVNIWDRNGKEIPGFQHSNNFFPLNNPISFSPDNNILASAEGQENIVLWNLQTKQAKTLKNQWMVCSIDFSSNSRELAVTEYLNRVGFWSIEDQKQRVFDEFGVISVIYSSEGIISTNWDGTIKLWNLFNGQWQIKSSWKGHSAPVWNASFSPDKKMLVSVSDDKTIKLWNLEGIKPPSFRPSNGTLGDMSLSPNGQTIAIVTADDHGSIKLLNLDGNPYKKTLQKVSPFSKITFSPDGKYLVSSHQSFVQMWSLESGESKTLIKEELSRGKRNDFGRASFSNDSKNVAIGRQDGTIKILRLDGTEIITLQGGSTLVSYSPNGKMIAAASRDNKVKLWSVDGQELQSLEGSPYSITNLRFSPDSKTLVAGNQNGNLIIWSVKGKRLHILQGHTSAVSSLTFRPDGTFFASASGNGSNSDDGTIKFWSIDGIEIKSFKTNSSSVPGINFSPDGKMLIWSNQVEVILWNLDLNYLLSKGCDWVRDYLQHNPNVSENDRHLCDGIGTRE